MDPPSWGSATYVLRHIRRVLGAYGSLVLSLSAIRSLQRDAARLRRGEGWWQRQRDTVLLRKKG